MKHSHVQNLGRWASLATGLRGLALALLLSVAAGCAGNPLGDPTTALSRLRDLQAEGRTEDVAQLGGRIVQAREASMEDRAEAAFAAGEAEFQRGRLEVAFERYRWVLENAPWSPHALAIEDRLFSIGRSMLFGEEFGSFFDDRGRGVQALEAIPSHFRRSERADDALKLVGDYFAGPDQEAYGEAALSYLRVVDEYPESEWAERCLWLAGHCRLLMANGPVYDRNDLLRASDLLERSIKTHPRGAAVREARADLAQVLEQLAEAELVVADFYERRGVRLGTELRLANAALLYPNTAAGRRAAERLRAAGIDPETLRGDVKRHSLDTVRATQPLWEREADQTSAEDDR
ncbi:MAG: outer membrane protein assembly factor BamD [Planctomycetota bacterium]